MPAEKEARIIDVGCGEGRVIYLLQRMGYTNATGVDISESQVRDEVLEFLNLCKTRLNSSGSLILQTPNASSPFFGDVRYGDFTHELAFTPRLLSQLVSRAGFGDIECRETGPVPVGYSIKSSIRYVVWQVIRMIICLREMTETGGCGLRIYTRVFLLVAKATDR